MHVENRSRRDIHKHHGLSAERALPLYPTSTRRGRRLLLVQYLGGCAHGGLDNDSTRASNMVMGVRVS
jgi:hypothetical protein